MWQKSIRISDGLVKGKVMERGKLRLISRVLALVIGWKVMPFTEIGVTGSIETVWGEIMTTQNMEYKLILYKVFWLRGK